MDKNDFLQENWTTRESIEITTALQNASTTDTPESVWHRYETMQALLYEFRPAVYYLRIYLPFLWIALGIPGNILSVIVWTKPRLKSSSGHYLAAGACFDLLNQIIRFFYALNKTMSVRIYDYTGICQLSSLLFTMCQYNHTILILAFTVERFIAIAFPFKRHRLCTRSGAIKVILLLVLVSLGFSGIQAYFYYNDATFGCSIRAEAITGTIVSLWTIWTWTTELFFFAFIPITILALNIKLIMAIKHSESMQEQNLQYFQSVPTEHLVQNGEKAVSPKRKLKSASATTLTLLTLSFYTIIMELPVTVLYCLYNVFPTGDNLMSEAEIALDGTWQQYLNYYSLRFTIENIAASHYAMGFYLSLFTTRTFRYEVARVIFTSPCCGDNVGKGNNSKTLGIYTSCIGDAQNLNKANSGSEYESTVHKSSPMPLRPYNLTNNSYKQDWCSV